MSLSCSARHSGPKGNKAQRDQAVVHEESHGAGAGLPFTATQRTADQPALAALGAGGEILASEGQQHFLPGFGLARGVKLLVLLGSSAVPVFLGDLRRARACSSLVLALLGAMRP